MSVLRLHILVGGSVIVLFLGFFAYVTTKTASAYGFDRPVIKNGKDAIKLAKTMWSNDHPDAFGQKISQSAPFERSDIGQGGGWRTDFAKEYGIFPVWTVDFIIDTKETHKSSFYYVFSACGRVLDHRTQR